ncbi:MAG: MFS transporter, partial [Gammaproteobacteria bacterium]
MRGGAAGNQRARARARLLRAHGRLQSRHPPLRPGADRRLGRLVRSPPPAAASSSSPQRIRVRWKIFLFLFGFGFIAYVQQRGITVAGYRMMSDLGLTQMHIGWLETALLIGYTAMQFPGGVIGQRLGARRMFVLIGLIGFAACMATPVAPLFLKGEALFGVLLAAQLLLGASQGPIFPVSAGVFEAWFTPDRWALVQGLQSMGLGLGASLTPPLIAWLMSAFDWQRALAWTTLPALVLIAWWAGYGRNSPAEHPAVTAEELAELGPEPPARPDASISWSRVWELMKDRDVLTLTVSYVCMNYVFYLLANWCFLYLVQERHFTVLESGWLASTPPLAAAIGAGVGGALASSLGKRYGVRSVRRAQRRSLLGGDHACRPRRFHGGIGAAQHRRERRRADRHPDRGLPLGPSPLVHGLPDRDRLRGRECRRVAAGRSDSPCGCDGCGRKHLTGCAPRGARPRACSITVLAETGAKDAVVHDHPIPLVRPRVGAHRVRAGPPCRDVRRAQDAQRRAHRERWAALAGDLHRRGPRALEREERRHLGERAGAAARVLARRPGRAAQGPVPVSLGHGRRARPDLRQSDPGQHRPRHQRSGLLLSRLQRDAHRTPGRAHQLERIRPESQPHRIRVAERPAGASRARRGICHLGGVQGHLQRGSEPPSGAGGLGSAVSGHDERARGAAQPPVPVHHSPRGRRRLQRVPAGAAPRLPPGPAGARPLR